jgi:beta-glucanase (GH16 family)
MRISAAMPTAAFLSCALLCASCSGSGSDLDTVSTQTQAAAPTISTTAAQHGAVIVSLATTTAGATIYYSVDGSAPSASSQQYFAPFLVASNLTVKAIAMAPDKSASSITSQSFAPNIASGTLVWSDEFSNSTGVNAQPNPLVWSYDTGNSGFGNQELENYCAWGSSTTPCSTTNPNAYTGTDGSLHIVARLPSTGVYTSARMKTQGMFSFQYGRIEARLKLPEGQGMWPAFWLLGNNITTVNWPACGELDVIEHINGSNPQNAGFDWVAGSIHGTGLDGTTHYHPAGFSAADWHIYGMIWTKGEIQFYVDSPANTYASFTPSTQAGKWPFDAGPQFVILNLAVGGNWPGSPDATTVLPAEVLVDYVRVYSN